MSTYNKQAGRRFIQQRNQPTVNVYDRVRISMTALVGLLKLSIPNISLVQSTDKVGQNWSAKRKKEPTDITTEVMLKIGEKNIFINPVVCLHDIVLSEGKVVVDNLYARRNEVLIELQGSQGMYASIDKAIEGNCIWIQHILGTQFIGKRGRPKWSRPSDYFVYLSCLTSQLGRNVEATSKGVQVLLGTTPAYAVTITLKLQDGETVDLPPFIGYRSASNPQLDPKKIYEAMFSKYAQGPVSDKYKFDVLSFNIKREL